MAFLDHGRAELQGKLSDIKTRYRREEYLVETESEAGWKALLGAFPAMRPAGRNQLAFARGEADVFDVLRFAADQRIALLRIEQAEPTLEALFMEAVEQ